MLRRTFPVIATLLGLVTGAVWAAPTAQLRPLGSSATFNPSGTAAPNTTYQWSKGGKAIVTAKSPTYNIAATKAADMGVYVLTTTDGSPQLTTETSYLGLVTPKLGSVSLKESATSALSLSCSATAPVAPGVVLKYQWTHNGAHLTDGEVVNGPITRKTVGATTKALKITGLSVDDSGAYTCVVTMENPVVNVNCNNGITTVTIVQPPVLSRPITLSNYTVSETVDETIVATFSPKFTATGLPPGVKLDPVTGKLSGKATAIKKGVPASYSVKFTVTNPAGTDTEPVSWTIVELDPKYIGTYYGVAERHGLTNFNLGGLVQITTGPTGVVSGSLTLAGVKYSVVGVLDASTGDSPQAHFNIKRTPALGDLKLDLYFDPGNRLTGTISDPQFSQYSSTQAFGDGTPGSAEGTLTAATFNGPRGLVLLTEGALIADTGNHTLRLIDSDDTTSVYAGLTNVNDWVDGDIADARFDSPEGLAFDSLGNLYVADTGNHCIRKITPAGVVSTLAGTPGVSGAVDGPGTSASFFSPCAIAVDLTNNLVVVDRGNHTLRKITPTGAVTTLAGQAEFMGFKDGLGGVAKFNTPNGITYDATLKAFFVADSGNAVIRKVLPTGAVSTYAGSPGVVGRIDGLLANARFQYPTSIISNGAGTLFVSDTVLIQITAGGIVAGITDKVDATNGLDAPAALSYAATEKELFVADAGLHGITVHVPTGPSEGGSFRARRAAWLANDPALTPYIANYTARITNDQPIRSNFPSGAGYATLSIKAKGVATWAGKAPDGAGLTCATVIGPDGEVPLHAILYKNMGSLQGHTSIDDFTGDLSDDGPAIGDALALLDWYKVAQPTASADTTYKAGFAPTPLALLGGKYIPANNLFSFLNLQTGALNAVISFTEGELVAPFDQFFSVTSPSKFTVPTALTDNPNGVKLTIAAATGLFSGSFTISGRKATIAGVLVHNENANIHRGFGHFLLPNDFVLGIATPTLSGNVEMKAAP